MRRAACILLAGSLLAACGGAPAAQSDLAPAAGALLNEWEPQIAVVFPRLPAGSKNVAESYAVNVSVWPANAVLCKHAASPELSLYHSNGLEPAQPVPKPAKLGERQEGSTRIPTEEFNDVPASLAADPAAKFNFVVYSRGQPGSNVWLHAGPAASPTFEPLKPTGYGSPDPASLDARIQVVFPHDDAGKAAPAKSATEVNVAVDLFQHGTSLSVPPDASYTPRLWWAQANARLSALPPGVQKTTYTLIGQAYPRWVFNDIRVQPGQTYHFLASLGVLGQHGGAYPTIWTYNAEAHTPLQARVPPSCIP
ncbi:MAG TPA: hypothetical protein VF157_16380 [Chloroflexota bacterium]